MAFHSVDAIAAPRFEIVSNNGDKVELRFRDMNLISRRADDAQNQLGMNFSGAVDPELYDNLQRALPDLIETAFGAYDNGVIRTRRPVVFETRSEVDGFSLRMIPRPGAATPTPKELRQASMDKQPANPATTQMVPERPDLTGFQLDERPTGSTNPQGVALRPSTDVHGTTRRFIVVSLAERPDDQNLIMALGLAAKRPPLASLWGGFRQNKNGRLAGGGGRFAVPVFDELKVAGSFGYTDAEGSSVRRLNGTRSAFSGHAIKGSAGLVYEIGHSGEIAGEAEIGPEGVGGIITAAFVAPDNYLTFKAAYHEHYEDTVEAVAMGATRHAFSMSGAQDLGGNLWAEGEIRGASYGVDGDSYVGKTIGFAAGLRYFTEIATVPVSFGYRVDADYVLDADNYPGVVPTPFTPLSLRNREIHRLTGAFTQTLLDDLWLDFHAGYALDRYASGGAFAGGQIRLRVTPGVQLVAAGRYSAVSARIGERGPESLFSLSLALSDE